MRNHHIARSSILALLLLAFTFAQAQITITPTVTPACAAGTGSVTFTLTGTSGTHYYEIRNLRSYATTGPQTSATFNNLAVGPYTVYAYGNQDSVSGQFDITSVVGVHATSTNATCIQSNGSLTVSVSGGTSPYSYHWSNGATTASVSGVPAAYYDVYVTDAGGCVSDTSMALVQAVSTVSASIAVTNGGTCNQTLTASGSGGQTPYSFHWNTGANTNILSNLSGSSTYTVTVTDANGCTAVHSTTISSTTLVMDSSGVVNPGCGSTNGSITANVVNGTGPYTFVWSTSATGNMISGLAAGTYTVTATDANGCTGAHTYYLSQSQVGTYAYVGSQPTCGNSDGSATAYGYGGNGIYTYSWSSGDHTSVATGLPAGVYTVTVTDGNQCAATTSLTLVGVANYNVSVSVTPTACDTTLHTGTATAIITGSGGTAPYSFAWYDTPPYYSIQGTLLGTTQTISNLGVGTYVYVTVLDANGCTGQSNYDTVSISFDPACYDHITGYAFDDANGNCVRDAGEQALSGAYISATTLSGQSSWASPDSSGYYDLYVLPGSYTVAATVYSYGACAVASCGTTHTASFAAIGQVSTGNDFGFNGSPSFDLGVHPGCTPSTPGTTKDYWVYYYNHGVATATGTVVSFTHDPNITLVSTNPAYTSYNSTTHVLTWNLGSLASSLYGGWVGVHMTFDVPNTLTLGSYLTSVAEIDPIPGDCDPSDNIVSMSDMVSGSHDPNEKEVSPAGNLTESDSVLTYTVRFQNDGNAPANLVIIKDTLSANVDPATVIPGAASHPYKFTMSGKGILTFTFEGINLPDSIHDEPHSKGFVNYTVHTKRNLPLGTQINNTAYIYFDFNTAVVTNTTTSTRSDFQTGIKNVNGDNGLLVTVSPNPVHDKSTIHVSGATGDVAFELMDVMGQKVMQTTITNKDLVLDGGMFAPGIYVYTVKDASGKIRSGKVLIAQ